jgi:hypothetical protein
VRRRLARTWQRDFSVNALALPLSRAARARHPEIVDPFDGVADLAARRLRVLHARSFHDDPTRALRAGRIGPRLGFSLTPSTRSALRSALRDGCFGRVSGDRLRRELERVRGRPPRARSRAGACACSTTGTCSARSSPAAPAGEAAVPLRRSAARSRSRLEEPRWRYLDDGLRRVARSVRRRRCAGALPPLSVRGETALRVAALPQSVERAVRALERRARAGAIDAAGRSERGGLFAIYASARLRCAAACAMRATTPAPARFGRRPRRRGSRRPERRARAWRIRAAFLDGAVSSREEALALAHEVARRSRRTKRQRPELGTGASQ